MNDIERLLKMAEMQFNHYEKYVKENPAFEIFLINSLKYLEQAQALIDFKTPAHQDYFKRAQILRNQINFRFKK